ncbi:unnamed protein product [Sphagnum compactum]
MAKRKKCRILVSDDEDEQPVVAKKTPASSSSSSFKVPSFRPLVEEDYTALKAENSGQENRKSNSNDRTRSSCAVQASSLRTNSRSKKGLNAKQRRGLLPFLKPSDVASADFQSGSRRSDAAEAKVEGEECVAVSESLLWTEKYSPHSVGDLAVHSKKIAEVRSWLEGQVLSCQTLGNRRSNRMLILTGPAGVGKTAVIRVLAKALTLEILEWKTPTPTLWQEHIKHQVSSGSSVPYMSKLDEFQSFLENARKFPLLPVSSHSQTKGVKLLVIDDLPVANDRERQQQLCRSLQTLALSVNFITVLLMTDMAETAEGDGRQQGRLAEIQRVLEAAGATKIAFNPITANVIKKLLVKIAVVEQCRVPADLVEAIADSCGGDVRNAILSLQFLCLDLEQDGPHQGQQKVRRISCKQEVTACEEYGSLYTGSLVRKKSSSCSIAGRDGILSLYHALGKFLYNKRHAVQACAEGEGTIMELGERFRRPPLNMEVPEMILSKARTETSSILAFLHENVLQFVDEDAIDDVAAIEGYLSDADMLLKAPGNWRLRSSSYQFSMDSDDVNPSHIAAMAADSVAARGVLFANMHPAQRKWQSLRAPALRQVEYHLAEKKMEIKAQAWSSVSFDSSCLNRDFMGAKSCSTFDMLPLGTSLEEEDEIEDV